MYSLLLTTLGCFFNGSGFFTDPDLDSEKKRPIWIRKKDLDTKHCADYFSYVPTCRLDSVADPNPHLKSPSGSGSGSRR